MPDLDQYAALAEIFSASAIIGGAIFALFQINEFRKRRRYQVAVDLCRSFTEPELAKAVTVLRSLPDNASLEELQARGKEFETSAQVVGMAFETMGLLVHKDLASFKIVQELAGGLLLMMWRKIGRWIEETREEQNNPRFGEWIQWLAERVQECESELEPAYVTHRHWNKHLS